MFKVWFIATIIGSAENAVSPTIETLKIDFTQGINLMAKCRKFEKQYHDGNDSISYRGNKLVSTRITKERKVITIETMCLEQE